MKVNTVGQSLTAFGYRGRRDFPNPEAIGKQVMPNHNNGGNHRDGRPSVRAAIGNQNQPPERKCQKNASENHNQYPDRRTGKCSSVAPEQPIPKIEKHATTIGVDRVIYATDLDYEVAILKQIAHNIKRPHKQQQSSIDGAGPDISDVIEET